MIIRARAALVCVYVLLILTGILSLLIPPVSVQLLVPVNLVIKIWSMFFIVGGVTSLFAIIMRAIHPTKLGWWLIEISGISLLTSACGLYAFVLLNLGLLRGNMAFTSIGFMVAAFSCSLAGRAWEAAGISRAERAMINELNERTQGGGRR